MTASLSTVPTLDDIQEAETCQWINEQLDRLKAIVLDNGADPELVEAIEYIREENLCWEPSNAASSLAISRQGLTTKCAKMCN